MINIQMSLDFSVSKRVTRMQLYTAAQFFSKDAFRAKQPFSDQHHF